MSFFFIFYFLFYYYYRKNTVMLFKKSQIGLNYNRKVRRNILHPHYIFSNMSGSVMGGTITLSPDMTVTHINKLT